METNNSKLNFNRRERRTLISQMKSRKSKSKTKGAFGRMTVTKNNMKVIPRSKRTKENCNSCGVANV